MAYSLKIIISSSGTSEPRNVRYRVGSDTVVLAEGAASEWKNLCRGKAIAESLYQLFASGRPRFMDDLAPGGAISNGVSYHGSKFICNGQTFVKIQSYDSASDTFGSATSIAFGMSCRGRVRVVFPTLQGTSALLNAGIGIQNHVHPDVFFYDVPELDPVGSCVCEDNWLIEAIGLFPVFAPTSIDDVSPRATPANHKWMETLCRLLGELYPMHVPRARETDHSLDQALRLYAARLCVRDNPSTDEYCAREI